ncbi:NrsF family protein [Pseudoxanthomonas wuyuanensis]|uniref:Anti-sigma-F factor NrsF n=1 Tax=Pseudoxanthomonas wuyuanensis TaxID=1073196 RepID=A0A286DFE7_9GAMM|nr:DUF1109 domain-containing protein [Pseudoxanthomonas wuyuanensis]KAF1719556.1 DUF1109 domain-containing protein [Pseudoxanthomonas wuyuanensis]SOD57319.1 hypothetical protein SAMN06296416_1131 [Pseudoxanthomonas wuyuanensis]
MEHDTQRQTDALIQRLAGEAGAVRPQHPALLPRLLAATGISLALAVLVVAAAFGIRDDLASHVFSPMYLYKAVAMVCFAIAGLSLVRAAGTPGASLRLAVALAPAVLVLVAGMMLLDDKVTLAGARAVSVPVCLLAIVMASLPALALMLLALRRATPTRPALAGAMAGLLAGSIGALAYTLACVNDGTLFVSVWYSLAILIACALGALAGRSALAW